MEFKEKIDTKKYKIGVIIGRFQVNELHNGHIEFINTVFKHHKKVVIFLGIPLISNTRSNPLDFVTRKAMLQTLFPTAIILPQRDQRSDKKWSENLDNQITTIFGEQSALLYGSRDSFIPHYSGKYRTIELEAANYDNGTDVREQLSEEVLNSPDFRAGVIYSTYAHRPVTYPTVDVVAYNDKNKILLAKKPNEDKYRFIGGFVDRTDTSWEMAAKREFIEESGGCEIGDLQYVASRKINDWRYAKLESGIMTTLFVGKFIFGNPKASDDICVLEWVDPNDITVDDIMPEHKELYPLLIQYLVDEKYFSSITADENR